MQNLVPRDYSKRARAHARAHTHTLTHRYPHTQAFWLYKAKYTQLKKWAANATIITGFRQIRDNFWLCSQCNSDRTAKPASWSILWRRQLVVALTKPGKFRYWFGQIDCFRIKCSCRLLFIASFKKRGSRTYFTAKCSTTHVICSSMTESKWFWGVGGRKLAWFVCAFWLASRVCHSEFGDT